MPDLLSNPSVLLQVSSTANLVVAALILTFVTVPTVLLILDRVKDRPERADKGDAETGETGASETAPPLLADVRAEERVDPAEAVHLVDSNTVDDVRWPWETPRQVGYVDPNRRMRGDLTYRGALVFGAHCEIDGDLDVRGGLVLGEGSLIAGDVQVAGSVFLEPAATVEGALRVDGNVRMAPWSRVKRIEKAGTVELDTGTRVDGRLRASRLIQGRVHTYEERSGFDGRPERGSVEMPSVFEEEQEEAAAPRTPTDPSALLRETLKAELDAVISPVWGPSWGDTARGRHLLDVLVGPTEARLGRDDAPPEAQEIQK